MREKGRGRERRGRGREREGRGEGEGEEKGGEGKGEEWRGSGDEGKDRHFQPVAFTTPTNTCDISLSPCLDLHYTSLKCRSNRQPLFTTCTDSGILH